MLREVLRHRCLANAQKRRTAVVESLRNNIIPYNSYLYKIVMYFLCPSMRNVDGNFHDSEKEVAIGFKLCTWLVYDERTKN